MVEFRVLGPVETVVDGRPAPLPAGKPRALLAILLLSPNRAVPVDRLIDELWGDEPPETATAALQVYVSQLRKALGADRVLTKPPGYALRIEEGELDLTEFERLAKEGRDRLAAGDAEAAARLLDQALSLWRGPAPADWLEQARLSALEDRIEADLARGRHDQVVPELERLIEREPYRERPRGQLMLALYRSGRQADALDVYRRTRETLDEELGIQPGESLQELERAILQHDPRLAPGRQPLRQMEPGAGPLPRARRRRLLFAGAALVAAAIAAAIATIVLASGGGSGNPKKTTTELRVFVGRIENFLTQSGEGRREVATTISRAFACKLPAPAAVIRLNRVQRNRQSLLQQIAALSVPDSNTGVRTSDLLQKAIQASIAADWHYRDWLASGRPCGVPRAGPTARQLRAADARATRAKRAFLATFNPLGRRFGRRVWRVDEF